MSSSNWGGKRLGAGKKPSWSIWEKIAIGAKCEELQHASREEKAWKRFWTEQGVSEADLKRRDFLFEVIRQADRSAVVKWIRWMDKELDAGKSYEDVESELLEMRQAGDLKDKTYAALNGIIENRENNLTSRVIGVHLGNGLSRYEICQITALFFQDKPNITTPSPHSADRIWKWYRKNGLAGDNLI